MAIIFQSGFEVAGLGDWDATVNSGTSSVVRSATAKKVGAYGLLITKGIAVDLAYVTKNFATFNPGTDRYIGFWVNVQTRPASSSFEIAWSASFALQFDLNSAGVLKAYVNDSGGNFPSVSVGTLALGTWYWVVLLVHRSSGAGVADGLATIWLNGVQKATVTGKQYYTTQTLNYLNVGADNESSSSVVWIDGVIVSDTYPSPVTQMPMALLLQTSLAGGVRT